MTTETSFDFVKGRVHADTAFHVAALILVIAVGWVAVDFAWTPTQGSVSDDGGSYMVMAHVFSPWIETEHAYQHAYNRLIHPPLFPLLLGLLNAQSNYYYAHGVVAILFALSIGVFYAWSRRETGSSAIALLGASAVALMPAPWMMMLNLISENLYMLLTLLFVWAATRYESGNRDSRLVLGMALIAASAILCRSIGVSLIAGVLWHSFYHWRTRHTIRSVAIIILTSAVIIGIWQAIKPDTANPYKGDVTFIISAILNGEHTEFVLQTLSANALGIIESWHRSLAVYFNFHGVRAYCIFALLALSLAGLAIDFFRGRIYAAMALAYLFIILVWPYPRQSLRFMYPLLPVMLLAIFRCVSILIENSRQLKPKQPVIHALTGILMLVIVSPSVAFISYRASYENDEARVNEIAEFYNTQSFEVALVQARGAWLALNDIREMRDYLPEDTLVLWLKPSLFTSLNGLPSTQFAHKGLITRVFLQHAYSTGAMYYYISSVVAPEMPDPNGINERFGDAAKPVWVRLRSGVIDGGLMKIDRERLRLRIDELAAAEAAGGMPVTQP